MWTIETLAAHVLGLVDERDRRYQQRFDGQDRAVQAALAAQEKAVAAALSAAERAVLKAEAAAERRFESQNEFRGQLADQAARQLPRAEAAVEFTNLRERLDELQKRIEAITVTQASVGGVAVGGKDAFARLVSVVGLIGVLISIFLALR
jgi:hypothetical protein